MPNNLITLSDFSSTDIYAVWHNAAQHHTSTLTGQVAWSFDGRGIRTRTSFIQAFAQLGLHYVELPALLQTKEPLAELAAYLDSFYQLYVIREPNHQALLDFAQASQRPVINAMSDAAHPCEVLTDAFYLQQKSGDIKNLNILLWGPNSNVFNSWHALAKILQLRLSHYCPKPWPQQSRNYTSKLESSYDVVITDAWPVDFFDAHYSLSLSKLEQLGSPILIPTPPISVGKELAFSCNDYHNFVGFAQKQLLLPVQQAIIRHLLGS